MSYVRPTFQFTDIPMTFESMTMDQARDASAAALKGEVVAEDFIGNSVAAAERYNTPIFSLCYVVTGYVVFRNYAYLNPVKQGGNQFAATDAYRAEIAAGNA